jgi:hypothetical protein
MLLILVGMALAAAGALRSWHERGLYIEASLLSEAFKLTATPRLRIEDHFSAKGYLPRNNAAAGLPPAQKLYGANVKRVSVTDGGVLVVDFDPREGQRTMVFTPDVNPRTSLLNWQCSSDTIDASILAKLELRCSHGVSPPVREPLQGAAIASADARAGTPEQGAQRNEQSPEVRRAELGALYEGLMSSARTCRVKRLESLLSSENDLEVPERIGDTLLASHVQQPECRATLTQHLSTKVSFLQGRDARFSQAVGACDRTEAEAMLKRHADIEPFQLSEGVSHFDRAVAGGCTDIVSLFGRERDIQGVLPSDVLTTVIQETPAASLVSMTSTLLRAGADVQHRDNDGETALGLSIGLEHPVVSKMLVDWGADVNAVTANGSTPLIAAAKKGYSHLVQQLIVEGVDLDAQDPFGRTALIAAVASDHGRVAELLVRSGANPAIRDQNGVDALLLADGKDRRKLRQILLAAKSGR